MLALLLALFTLPATLVPGTASTWTDGVHTWAGNPYCAEAGVLLSPQSPAIDAGVKTELDCPAPGSALNQPRLNDGFNSYCREWYGTAPDIGACEYVPAPVTVPAPDSLNVSL